jgi:hypothetical protein
MLFFAIQTQQCQYLPTVFVLRCRRSILPFFCILINNILQPSDKGIEVHPPLVILPLPEDESECFDTIFEDLKLGGDAHLFAEDHPLGLVDGGKEVLSFVES